MKQKSNLEIKLIANNIREDIIKTLLIAKSGHTAGPLGMADIFASLYFNVLNHDPKNPNWPDRDKLFLSAGHICPVLYVTLAHAGYFEISELKTLRKINSRLQGHPHNLSLPGLENTSGPLGQGLSQAIGSALAAKLDEKKIRIYAILSDGEHDEGQTWEAYMFAAKYKLNNITVIIDRNNIQIDGFTENVMPLEPFVSKLQSFNWNVIEVDGHNIPSIIDACNEAKSVFERPTIILAHTIPGKGVDFMENDFKWHGVPPGISDMEGEPPKDLQGKIALNELRTLGGKIKSEHE